MTYDTLIETSNLVLIAKKICQPCSFIGKFFFEVQADSRIYKCVYGFRKISQNISRYSIIRQTVERIGKNSETIFEDSIFLSRLWAAVKVFEHKLYISFSNSFLKSFYIAPVQAISFGVIIACLTNLSLSLIAKNEIGFLGWVITMLILFAGLIGLYARVNWDELKETSCLLRWLKW